jgi:hypothetical protein
MGGERDERTLALRLNVGHHVASPVELGLTAYSAELGYHPLGAALFLKGWGGNAAQL